MLHLVNNGSTDDSQETARSLTDEGIVHLNCGERRRVPSQERRT
jgi:hypothetical protein